MGAFPTRATEWLAQADALDIELIEIDDRISAAARTGQETLRQILYDLKEAKIARRDQSLSFAVKASEGWA